MCAKKKEKRNIKWGVVDKFAFATIDFATDIIFLIRLSYKVGALSYILYVTGVVSLTISICWCLAAVAVALSALKADRYKPNGETFQQWQSTHPLLVALVCIISATRNDALAFLFSETKVPCLGCFDAPVSPEMRRKVEELGLVAVAIEDVPQLIIQIIYLTFVDSSDASATLSLTCTALNILLQVISKVVLSSSNVDGNDVLDGMRDKLENINLKKENGTLTEEQAEEETVKILQDAAKRNGLPLYEMFSYLRQAEEEQQDPESGSKSMLAELCPKLEAAANFGPFGLFLLDSANPETQAKAAEEIQTAARNANDPQHAFKKRCSRLPATARYRPSPRPWERQTTTG